MKVIAYEFKEGARFQSGAISDAGLVGRHLELLRKKFKGELTPQDVIDDARHNNSPLHSFFEWNDGKAAAQHRLAQARGLIRSVVAVYRSTDDKVAKRIQAFVHIPEAGAPHYRSIDDAMSRKKTRELVLRQAWREFQSWRKRYEQIGEFAALFEAADTIAQQLPALQSH